MPPAGAADGDGEAELALLHIERQQEGHKVFKLFHELLRLRAAEDELRDGVVEAGLVAQLRDVIGVREKADVEDEVRFDRDAVFVTEGHDVHDELAPRVAADEHAVELRLEHAEREVRGVDDVVCALAHRGKELDLVFDRRLDRDTGTGQRVAAARLLVALDDVGGVGLHKEDAVIAAEVPEAVEDLEQFLKARALADVGDEGHTFIGFARRHADLRELRNERDRHIVDTVVAQILQHIRRAGFARARKS